MNCNRFADSADMHAETLWTTNTCEDSEHQWKFNEEGLRFMTASSDLIVQSAPEPAREMAPEQVAKQARTANGVGKVALMQSGPNMPVAADSTMRKQKRSKVKKAPPVSSAADCTSSANRDEGGCALGQDVAKLSQLKGWRAHGPDCSCGGCMILANTVAWTMRTPGFDRFSGLAEHDLGAVPVLRPALPHARNRGHVSLNSQSRGRDAFRASQRGPDESVAMAGFKSKKFEEVRHCSVARGDSALQVFCGLERLGGGSGWRSFLCLHSSGVGQIAACGSCPARSRPATRSAHAWRARVTNTDSVTYRRSAARQPGCHWAAGSSWPQCRLRPTVTVRACLRTGLFPLARPRGRLRTAPAQANCAGPSTPTVHDSPPLAGPRGRAPTVSAKG